MADDKERLVPFTEETFKRLRRQAALSRRAFKQEAAVLIEEALDAREHEQAPNDG